MQQGLILRNVEEYVPTGQHGPSGTTQVEIINHPLVVVMSPECDLVSDYENRTFDASADLLAEQANPQLLQHIQCCDLFAQDQIRDPHGLNRHHWNFVNSNRHPRYHRVMPELIGRPDNNPLYLDFKRVVSVSTRYLYASLIAGGVQRDSTIAQPWIDELVQRCYHFQSRVCVPDPRDTRPSALARVPE